MVNFSALQRKKDARPGLEPHSSYESTAWESRASSGAPMPGILDRYLKSSLIITDAIEKVEFIKWSNNEISHFEIIQYLCVCNVVKVTPKMVNVTPADDVIDTVALVNLVGVLLRVAGYIETLLNFKSEADFTVMLPFHNFIMTILNVDWLNFLSATHKVFSNWVYFSFQV